MPKYYETFLCTAVPQSLSGTKLRLAILVSPRLTAEPDPGGEPVTSEALRRWPDALNWAAILPTWTVTLTQDATTVSTAGQEVGGGYDVQTWNAIFPADMPTTPYVPPVEPDAAENANLLPTVATFQVGRVREAVKDLHVTVLNQFRTQFPLLDQLSGLAEFAPIRGALAPDVVREVLDTQLAGGTVGSDMLEEVFAQLDLFHGVRPGSDLPAPTVTAVTPASGSPSGGTTVTITGTTFTGGSTVFFGGVPATNVVVTGLTSITCRTPPGTFAAQVDVVVRTPGGVNAPSAAARYTYLDPPTVTKVDKNRGPAAGGNTVLVTGTNFAAGNGPDGQPLTTVRFGDVPATDVRVGSTPNSLECTVPAAGDDLVVDVVVTTKGGSSATSAASRYTYVRRPAVTAVNPTSGPVAGGQTVTVTGTDLAGATDVHFGTARTAPAPGGTATSLTCATPAGTAGTVTVTVTTEGGTSATADTARYTYLARPTVTALSPATGPAAGGTVVTVTGTNLGSATSVTFGGVAGTGLTAVTATSLRITSPAGTAGAAAHVVVHTTLAGDSTPSDADLFTYAE